MKYKTGDNVSAMVEGKKINGTILSVPFDKSKDRPYVVSDKRGKPYLVFESEILPNDP